MAYHPPHSKNNKFPTTHLHKLKHQTQHRITRATPPTRTENSPKWATFTLTSPHIRRITNLFKNTTVRIALRSNNTVVQLTKPPNDHKIPPRNKWGIYQLTCNSYSLSYVGQTSRSLKVYYKEHIRYIRYNNPKSAYAQHILSNQHEYGTMNNVMTLTRPLNNPNMLTPFEQFHIQTFHQKGSSFLNNTQAIRTLCSNWPFTPLYHLTRLVVQHPSAWKHTMHLCT